MGIHKIVIEKFVVNLLAHSRKDMFTVYDT